MASFKEALRFLQAFVNPHKWEERRITRCREMIKQGRRKK